MGHSLAAVGAVVAAPVAMCALTVRPAWRVGVAERLGALARPEPGRVWVHGASVGEAFAAVRLISRLRADGLTAFASSATPAGREVLRRELDDVPSALAPIDHPWCVESALARVNPQLLVLVETELWPAWIAAARRRGVPVVVASGRLSDRSFPRYRRLRRLLAPTLQRIDAVGARSPLDAERFVALGVPPDRVTVTGDLKLDPPEQPAPLAPDLARSLAGAPTFVAGSTHAGEELAVLDALEGCERAGVEAAMVVAPRHISRVPDVARQLASRGRSVRRRSRLDGAPLESGEVLLLDSVGELPALYTVASLAYVGGTLTPVGGHNVLEPVFAGCPVLFGPHIANVRAAVELVEQSGAGRQVADDRSLVAAVVEALGDLQESRRRGEAGRRALAVQRGSAGRSAALVKSLLDPSSAGNVREARARHHAPLPRSA